MNPAGNGGPPGFLQAVAGLFALGLYYFGLVNRKPAVL